MQKNFVVIILAFVLIVSVIGIYDFNKITGKAVSEDRNEVHTIGPSAEEISCMSSCMQCTSPGVDCKGDQETCMAQCNAKKLEVTEDTKCMEECVIVGCSEFDFSCQGKNKDKCEEECNMVKEPEAKSEEQKCIQDCVNQHSPGTICKPSKEGEQGNDVCQMCSKQCVHLYAGPCLNDEKLQDKKKECQTCEHCYGEPIMGDSGEDYECIVDVECKDASSEFGDNPGIGEGIIKGIGNVFESIGDFFSNLFGGGEEETAENTETANEENTQTSASDNSATQE